MKLFVVLLLAVSATADNCPSPTTCSPDQIACPMGAAGTDGCPAPVSCMAAKTPSPIYGAGMCQNFCPMNCSPNQMPCPGGTDMNGCQLPGTCIPMPDPSEPCPQTCPMTCPQGQMPCPGQMMGNCTGPTTCMPQSTTVMVPYQCPGYCSWPCNTDEFMCPGPVDMNGCQQPGVCIKTMSADMNGNMVCPNTCPTMSCSWKDQIMCPGQMNANGCRNPDVCVSRMMGTDNTLCPGNCPVTCAANEISCYSNDVNGCALPTTCIPMSFPSPIGDSTCPNFCPNQCQTGSIMCPGPIDSFGCAGMPTCIPIQMGTNNQPCPASCPVTCSNEMVQCPTTMDSNGCMTPAMCMANLDKCPKSC